MSTPIKRAEDELISAFTGTRQSRAIEKLSNTQVSNPGSLKCNGTRFPGWTLLHLACLRGWHDLVRTLVEAHKCKPAKIKNDDGQTPLFIACRYGHLQVVQYLVKECHCDPQLNEEKDDGTTPFQVACMYGRLNIIKYLLLDCNCDPLKRDRKGDTALAYAATARNRNQVVAFLLTTGKLDHAPDEEFQMLQSQNLQRIVVYRRNHPFHPAFKVCVVGNQSAGKSTLVKALENRLTDTRLRPSLVNSVTGRFTKVAGVELQTAGIVPLHIHSPTLGHIIMYDFAGQYEYYSSHTAYLENIVTANGVLFLLVVDVSKSEEEVQRTLYYWNSFVDNLTAQCPIKPQIMVVGSHADMVKKTKPSKKLSATCVKLDCTLGTTLDANSAVIDCTQNVSSSLNSICDTVAKCSQEFLDNVNVDMQVHFVYGVIKESHLNCQVACRFANIAQLMYSEENASFREDDFLPSDEATLSKHLTTLSEHGQLLYLRNDQCVNDSWVILNKELLLSQVNGTIFAPDYFKEHKNISSSTGVVPLSEIKKIFPDHDPQMIVSFLVHLKFCHQVEESEAVLISGDQLKSRQNHRSESYFFFPALVSDLRPVESCQSVERTHYRCGWCLERTQEDQFFSPRFLHVLLLRLAFHFALDLDDEKPSLVVQKSCNVWSSGIHWQNNDGVEAIVEVVEQSTAVTVVVGCQEGGEVASVQLRSGLIKTVLEIKEKFSGAVEVRESFVDPSELDNYPLVKSPRDLSKFGVNAVARAVAEEKVFVTRKQDFDQQLLPLRKLLLFEPYSCFSTDLLCQIFDDTNVNKDLSRTFLEELSEQVHHETNRLKKVLGVTSTDIRASSLPVFGVILNLFSRSDQAVKEIPAQCSRMLRVWKKRQNHRSYGDLRAALDCYSVFCGRNPLVLSGVCNRQSVQGDPQDSLLASTRSDKYATWCDLTQEVAVKYEDLYTYACPRKFDKPTMRYLELINSQEGGNTVRVITGTASRWEALAAALQFGGDVVENVGRDHQLNCIGACRRILITWLGETERGLRSPVTWLTLIQCLREAEFRTIADSLDQVLM